MSEGKSDNGWVVRIVLFLALACFSAWGRVTSREEGQVVETSSQREMREKYDRAVAVHSNAVNHMQAGRYQEAIDGFTKALAIAPGSSNSLVHRGMAYSAMEMWEEALADFERVSPYKVARTHELASWRGRCLFFLGRAREAEEAYTEALEHSPNSLRLRLDRAQVRGHLNDLEGALEDFDAIFKQDVDIFKHNLIAEAHYSRGCLLVSRGEIGKGRTDIERALKMGFRPKDTNANQREESDELADAEEMSE